MGELEELQADLKHYRALLDLTTAAGVIAIDDDWPNGDYPHIGCRCWYELAELDEDEESQ